MEIQGLHKINPQYSINKAEQQKLLQPRKTKKTKDTNTGIIIYPFLSVSICDNLILQSPTLQVNIETLSEDVVLNNISTDEEKPEINDFWENNLDSLCDTYKDYISYGFGAAEILYDTEHNPVELTVIPADTLTIHKKKKYIDGKEQTYYYAVQSITAEKDVTLRLSHLEYPEEDKDLPVCLWLGGGRKSDFYDYPLWLSAFNHISASVTLDLLNNKKLNEGNLMSGVLVIKRPPAIMNADGDKQVQDTLEDKMMEKGNGIFTLELTSLNKDIPLEVDYIQINESNYEYLNSMAETADLKIMSIFKIPEARLLRDTSTESMNSNKTATLYKIYTIELNNRQRRLEKDINRFNKSYFDFNGKFQLETPVFDEEIETQINNLILVFNNGLITLGDAIKQLNNILPELELDTDNLNSPVYEERYYNGNPLGLNGNIDNINPITSIGDFIEMEKINQVFSRENSD